MSKSGLDMQKVAAQIEEVADKYGDIKKNTENEIAKLKQQLLDIGIQGSTIVKLQPLWHHDVDYLLRIETENLNKKAG